MHRPRAEKNFLCDLPSFHSALLHIPVPRHHEIVLSALTAKLRGPQNSNPDRRNYLTPFSLASKKYYAEKIISIRGCLQQKVSHEILNNTRRKRLMTRRRAGEMKIWEMLAPQGCDCGCKECTNVHCSLAQTGFQHDSLTLVRLIRSLF